MRTHYDNLHISEKASPEVIRAAYKALAQKWHPDKNPDQREKAERYFKIITQAFDVLSDPALRARYDAWLKEKRSAEPEKPEPEATKEPPQQNSDQTRMAEAWEDGKRSREQGFKENDCPYDGALAGAWQQGFKSGQKVSTPHDADPRPWPRFFARLIDTLTLGFASMLLVSFMAAFLFGVDISAYFSGSWIAWLAAVSGCLVITEAFLVHRLATTPGKWLFGIRVYFHDGTKLSFNNSLERAASALIIGQAANIPGLSVITNLIAYSRLKKTGTTFWDKQSKSRVECAPMSAGRVTACTLVTLVAILTNSVLIGAQVKGYAKSTPVELGQSQPQPAPETMSQEDIHFRKVYAAHPDADSVIAAHRFKQWVGWNASRGGVYENGTADEVIQLLSDYKQHTAELTEEIDNYLASVYKMYPGLNSEGQNPNQPAIEEVVKFRDQYINNGNNTIEALQAAVNAVAIKRRWTYPQDSIKK